MVGTGNSKVRPPLPKREKPYHCTSCRKDYDKKSVKRLPIGDNRFSIFCPVCEVFLKVEEEPVKKTQANN
jgi:hypothetical protein